MVNCMENKTELTKRKMRGTVSMEGGRPHVVFVTNPTIKKINNLFPDFLTWVQCFDEYGDGFGRANIRCEFSDDFKELTSMNYIIDEFKYDWHKKIPCEDIFNEEELHLIREQAFKIMNKYNEVLNKCMWDLSGLNFEKQIKVNISGKWVYRYPKSNEILG